MGLLFTTEGTRRILDTLNIAFDGPSPPNGPLVGLDLIRKAISDNNLTAKIKKADWAPGHFARMLYLLPIDQASANLTNTKTHNGRWHHFLRKIVAGGNDPNSVPYQTVFAPLRSALADAILTVDPSTGKPTILRVSFDHVEIDEPAAPTSTDGNAPPSLVIFDAPLYIENGSTPGKLRHITLFTVRVHDLNANGSVFQGSDFDGADTSMPDQPSVPWRRNQNPPS